MSADSSEITLPHHRMNGRKDIEAAQQMNRATNTHTHTVTPSLESNEDITYWSTGRVCLCAMMLMLK